MDDLDEKRAQIEDSSERFPQQMIMIREIFAYSFDEVAKITKRFGSNTELLDVIQQVRGFIAQSDLPEERKQFIDFLLQEEIDVMSFSQTSRSSVISL